MNAVDFLFAAGYLAVIGYAIRAVCRRLPGGKPKRTAAQVTAALQEARRARDLATCQLIWPDPPSARVIEAQYRHDTAKQRKENEQ
ncbi:hypothetical protein ACH4D4_04750 [Streptomyces pristinaespiralis]|uniref:hypothetical protein n=1 Tax=Streptomyces pristinaespiralis TaxID=38300 RepID=UPI0037B168E9